MRRRYTWAGEPAWARREGAGRGHGSLGCWQPQKTPSAHPFSATWRLPSQFLPEWALLSQLRRLPITSAGSDSLMQTPWVAAAHQAVTVWATSEFPSVPPYGSSFVGLLTPKSFLTRTHLHVGVPAQTLGAPLWLLVNQSSSVLGKEPPPKPGDPSMNTCFSPFQWCGPEQALEPLWASVTHAQNWYGSYPSHGTVVGIIWGRAQCLVNTRYCYYFCRGFSTGCKPKCLPGNVSEWGREKRLSERKMPSRGPLLRSCSLIIKWYPDLVLLGPTIFQKKPEFSVKYPNF